MTFGCEGSVAAAWPGGSRPHKHIPKAIPTWRRQTFGQLAALTRKKALLTSEKALGRPFTIFLRLAGSFIGRSSSEFSRNLRSAYGMFAVLMVCFPIAWSSKSINLTSLNVRELRKNFFPDLGWLRASGTPKEEDL
jgi:hypothetical protein